MDFILDFSKLDKSSLPMVGGKNASLGEMINAGIRVPPGFAVTTDSYSVFIDSAKIQDKIFDLLSDLNPDNIEALNKAAADVQELILTAAIPDDVQKAIGTGYSQLCEQCEVNPLPVAVRSSATAEDLPTASFAGQQDTYLWIQKASRIPICGSRKPNRSFRASENAGPACSRRVRSAIASKTNFPTKKY